MLKNIIYLLFFLCGLCSCIDPYDVDVKNYKDLLVVDACITNENKSHQVKLTRSIANLGEKPIKETNASVVITCNDGSEEVLAEVEPGIYKTDSVRFVGKIGSTYKLLIRTSGGKSYQSEECTILNPMVIEKIFYKKNTVINFNNEELEGVSFFVDGKASENTYLRWKYNEDWKFSMPHPYLVSFDENQDPRYVSVENFYCWKKSSSPEIIIQSLQNQTSLDLKGKEICFIPSDNTDRFRIKYALNIKQISISKREYEYWERLKNLSEEVGDVFGTQPFTIKGNVKSDIDENEPVLGYFQTGSVATKRIFVDYDDVDRLDLSLKNSHLYCTIDTIKLEDVGLNTLYSLYQKFGLKDNYVAVQICEQNAGLIFSQRVCTDCSLTGSSKKPSFWED